MAKDALVEFWGCNIGKVQEAGKAWSELFHSEVRATTGKFTTEEYHFASHCQEGEECQKLPNRKGLWQVFRNSEEVKKRDDKTLQRDFRNQLLLWYRQLIQHGDIPAVEHTEINSTSIWKICLTKVKVISDSLK